MNIQRRDFLKIVGSGAIAAAMPVGLSAKEPKNGIDPEWDGITNPHPQLKDIGNKFSFAVNADPQVSHYDVKQGLAYHSNYNLSETVRQLNQRKPDIKFIEYLGDIVNVPDIPSMENFLKRSTEFKGLNIITHGNHDTSPPYTRFRDYQEKINGIRSVYYSFDVGKWHFITIPANTEFGNYENLEVDKYMFDWLEKDINTNSNRPTMIFIHLHVMPQGLSQLEWYTNTSQYKKRLIDILARHGNVKYLFNGHVHNGIKVSLKTAWTYRGINFITLPSGTAPRPFGEEFVQFEQGLEKGGYYTIFDIDGEDVKITSKNVYTDAEFVYPKTFRKFKPEIEPRLFEKVINLPAAEKIQNPGFENGLYRWYTPLRYNCDGLETGFLNEWRMKHKKDGQHSGYVYSKPLGEHWLQDEYNEFYQIVKAPKGSEPLFKASYLMEVPPQKGGGYFTIMAVSGPDDNGKLEFLMHFNWGQPKHQYFMDYYPRAVGYHTTGKVSNWLHLQQLGKKKQGLFFDLPNQTDKWHDLQANISQIYDNAIGKKGAYDKLNIVRFVISSGTYCIKGVEIGSGAFVDEINLTPAEDDTVLIIDGKKVKIDESVFKTPIGQWLQDELDRQKNFSMLSKDKYN